MSVPTYDRDLILRLAGLDDDSVALRLAEILQRLFGLLPTKCVDEINKLPSETRLDKLKQLVWSVAAVGALGQSSKDLCAQQDCLHRCQNDFGRDAPRHEAAMAAAEKKDEDARRRGVPSLATWPARGEERALLASLAWSQVGGLRSVLAAQLDREFYMRNGRPVPQDVQLPPAGSSGSGAEADLELVPFDPADKKGKGGRGGGGSAAPATVVSPSASDPQKTDSSDNDDGLDFLRFDRDR